MTAATRIAGRAAFATAGLLARIAAALLVSLLSFILFLIAIAFVAYRLPAFQERQVFEGRVQWKKIEMEDRTVFESVFDRNIVRLDGKTVLYIRAAGNEDLWRRNGSYRAKVSASPLLFGGFADAELLEVR